MRTKHILFICLAISFLFSCSKNNVRIKGDIKNAAKQKVYLEQLNVDNTVIIDSTKTNRKGNFKFKVAVKLPTFFNIRIGEKETVTIIAEPENEIELTGTLKDLSNNYWVDGSENSLWIKLLNFQLNNTRVALDSLKKIHSALPETAITEQQRLAAEYDSIVNKQISFSKDFILQHAISPASYYALYQKFDNSNYILPPEEYEHSYKVVASSLKAMYPESQYTTAILKHLEEISKNRQNQKLRELIANSENSLPAIELPNAKGDTIALSSLNGKFVILDFTVLGSNGSQAYINELKQIYNKFRHKELQIYQVCLDPDNQKWENLVKQYGIDWICVRDPEGLQSRIAKLWNVQNLPANYIINPKLEIVGKNLDGRRLEERLNHLLK